MEVLKNARFVICVVACDNHASIVAAYRFLLKENGRERNNLPIVPVARKRTNIICTSEQICYPSFFTIKLLCGRRPKVMFVIQTNRKIDTRESYALPPNSVPKVWKNGSAKIISSTLNYFLTIKGSRKHAAIFVTVMWILKEVGI